MADKIDWQVVEIKQRKKWSYAIKETEEGTIIARKSFYSERNWPEGFKPVSAKYLIENHRSAYNKFFVQNK